MILSAFRIQQLEDVGLSASAIIYFIIELLQKDAIHINPLIVSSFAYEVCTQLALAGLGLSVFQTKIKYLIQRIYSLA